MADGRLERHRLTADAHLPQHPARERVDRHVVADGVDGPVVGLGQLPGRVGGVGPAGGPLVGRRADRQERLVEVIDRRRYANDLRITMAYLREALRLRTLERPAAVALVLSKTDALFASAEDARKALSDDVLHRALGPLVHLIQQSDRVSDAVIIPTTAFGFGKAVLRGDGGERHEAPGSAEEPFGDEPIWLLKEGESPQPYNLDTLFLWSLLLGLLNQAGPNPAADPELDTVCRMLRDDLEAGDPWLVPLKGGVKLATA